LGHKESGKTGLVQALTGTGGMVEEEVTRPETSSTHFKIRRRTAMKHSSSNLKSKLSMDEEPGEDLVVHLIFTDVPETAAASQGQHFRQLTELFGTPASPKDRICDLAMLVFDCTNASTLAYAKDLESSLLTKETPRVFVGTKVEAMEVPEPEDGDASKSTVVETSQVHCREFDLEPPLVLSNVSPLRRPEVLDHLARCVLREPGIPYLRSRPHEERQRREASRRRKMLWLGSIVTVGVVVAVGVGILLGRSPKKDKPKVGLGWLRSFFGPRETTAASPSAS
jgi:hypothetical protein